MSPRRRSQSEEKIKKLQARQKGFLRIQRRIKELGIRRALKRD
jgi:hypothetical protein